MCHPCLPAAPQDRRVAVDQIGGAFRIGVSIDLFDRKLSPKGLDVRFAVIDREPTGVAERPVSDSDLAAIFTLLLNLPTRVPCKQPVRPENDHLERDVIAGPARLQLS